MKSYKNISVKEYQRIFPAIRKAKKEYSENATWFDYTEFMAVIKNIQYEDAIDIPENETLKYNFLLTQFLPNVILKEAIEIKLFWKKQKVNFDQIITTGQMQAYQEIILSIDNPLKTAEVQEIFSKLSQKDTDLTDAEIKVWDKYMLDCFEGRIMNMHKLAAIFVQKKYTPSKVDALANKLLSQNVLNVWFIVTFFLYKKNDWTIGLMEFMEVQLSIIC